MFPPDQSKLLLDPQRLPGLSVLDLRVETQHLSPTFHRVDCRAWCPKHRLPGYDIPTDSETYSNTYFISRDVVHVLDAAGGGPAAFWRAFTLPRRTAQIQALADAIPSLRLVRQRMTFYDGHHSQPYDREQHASEQFEWRIVDGIATVEATTEKEGSPFPDTRNKYVCPCSLNRYARTVLGSEPEPLSVGDWWRDVQRSAKERGLVVEGWSEPATASSSDSSDSSPESEVSTDDLKLQGFNAKERALIGGSRWKKIE